MVPRQDPRATYVTLNGAASGGTPTSLGWYEMDLTSLVTGDGTFSLRATSTSSKGAAYTSKEGTAGFAPRWW